jgi:hypothetical protein
MTLGDAADISDTAMSISFPATDAAPRHNGERARMSLKQRRFWQTLLLFVPLMLIVAFRGDTGDTGNYVAAYDEARQFPWNPTTYYADAGMEWGFGLASWLVTTLGQDVRVLFLLISFGTFYFLARAAERVGTNLLAVAPYYLGNYFLVQQFLQIRQGLAVAFAFSVLPLILVMPPLKKTFVTFRSLLLASLMHFASITPMVVGIVLNRFMPRPTRRSVIGWTMLIILVTFAAARTVMSLDVFSALGRLADYASDTTYSSERDILAPANVRAVLILFLFWIASPPKLLRSRTYVVMLGMYACHVGIRFGFYDFLIISGRLSTTLGFAEVLMLPLLVRHTVRNSWIRFGLGAAYLALHCVASLQTQLPTLIDDYFAPLQYHRSAD